MVGYAITSTICDETNYLAYNDGNICWDGDGYFWTSFEIFLKCIPQNTRDHVFFFETEKEAKYFAKHHYPFCLKCEIKKLRGI